MTKKLGRPKLPKRKARGFVTSIRFLPDEDEQICAAALKAGLSKSDWMRQVLLDAARSAKG
jgi:hypothetical protein